MASLMKGYAWKDKAHTMTYPCAVEIKHDEIRCEVRILGDTIEYLSYAGKPLANMQRFDEAIRELGERLGTSVLDCGIEVNGNFGDSYRWVRSTKTLPPDLLNANVVLYVFDMPLAGDMRYQARRDHINAVAPSSAQVGSNMLYIRGLACSLAYSPEEVEAKYEAARRAGFEGLMVKRRDHIYKAGKRTADWLKVKPECDASFVVANISQAYAADGTPLHRVGALHGEIDGQSVSVGTGFDHETAKSWWYDPSQIIGQTIDFTYMMLDRQGGYRHTSYHRIREATK